MTFVARSNVTFKCRSKLKIKCKTREGRIAHQIRRGIKLDVAVATFLPTLTNLMYNIEVTPTFLARPDTTHVLLHPVGYHAGKDLWSFMFLQHLLLVLGAVAGGWTTR